jgi:RNA polymerase sigma factor (sigma-70 family)
MPSSRLTPDLEQSIRARLRAGDEAARDELLRLTLGLARWAASRSSVPRHLREDATSEARLAIVAAGRAFTPDDREPFAWTASTVARLAAWRFVQRETTIAAPQHHIRAVLRIARATNELTRRLRRVPTVEEIAIACGISAAKVEATLVHAGTVEVVQLDGLDSYARAALTSTAASTGPTQAATMERAERARWLLGALAQLPHRERTILEEFYGLGNEDARNGAEIAVEMGCSREWIRCLRARAETKLREMAEVASPLTRLAPRERAVLIVTTGADGLPPATQAAIAACLGLSLATVNRTYLGALGKLSASCGW